MKKRILTICLLVSAIAVAQKPIFTSAKTKSATVYFSGAEITQSTSVNLPIGTSEIVIKNVADYLNENTVQIGAPKNVTVLSVQFSDNYVSEYELDESNPAIKRVRDSITYVQKELKKIQIDKNSHQQTIEILDKNKEIRGANSGLNVAELMKLVEYYKSKRTELDNAVVLLAEKETKWRKTLDELNNKLEINTQKEEKISEGKLILQVMNEVAGNVNLDISYITNSASWQPFYDLRTENITAAIDLAYKAKVTQSTGIDWKKVKLTLSSGNPNQNNVAPLLQAWFLRYGNYKVIENRPNSNVTNTLQGQLAGVNVTAATGQPGAKSSVVIRGVGSINANSDPLYVINGFPSTAEEFRKISPTSIKDVRVIKDEEALSEFGNRGSNGVIVITTKNMNDYTTIEEQELNVSFDIDIPYDILSNGKAHSVSLKDIKIPATYKYYAAPKVEKEAFLLAELNDYAKYNLLPGEANIVFEGMYVGKTMINPNQTQDTLNLSMGRDKKISIKRERITDKSGTKFLSSYKEQTFTYDITVRNNKKEDINMLLKDQYPLSTDKEITVELLEKDGAKENEETGVLTWEIKLKPNETKKYRISYKVKYPKDKIIGNL
ncbi:mucoidy inhibitor MuiA family protein [Flavobacterium sp.]|uniref:mucoidy inhibitor MuiA family protein n=1 Tax=Flavobacterium sp. TaxID=239 RepID=UPI001B6925C6|nr:mucoidy inhibitor MuiA family protein [Flavobacterium sp.]MBP6127734.1 mucoidy inhibitor MuiA family protein [Flavobacterium sp.]